MSQAIAAVIVVVIHDIKPEREEQARARIDGNSALIAGQPGFVFRHSTTEQGRRRVVTVTGWRSAEDLAIWNAHKRTLPQDFDPNELYDCVESITTTTYDERWGASVTPGNKDR